MEDPDEDGMAVDDYDGMDVQPQRTTAADRIERLEARVAKNPVDVDAWNTLVLDAQAKGVEAARAMFERVLKALPTAVRFWKQYIEQEVKVKNYPLVEQLFSRCLLACPNVDIWRLYVNYVRTVKESTPTGRDEVIKAFEFALEHIGIDIHSTPLWQDYVAFLKAGEVPPAEKEMRLQAIRRVYQRACELPIHDVEKLWRQYEEFEGSQLPPSANNRAALKIVLGEMIPKFTSARGVWKEKKALYEGLVLNALPRLPRSSAREEHQANLWQRLLAYERTNPQRLDPQVLRTRVSFVYNQCLLCLYFYPGIWYDFALWLAEIGANDMVVPVFDRALAALPNNLILHFAKADYLESTGQIAAAEAIYTGLTTQKPDPLVWIQYMKFARRAKGAPAARQVFLLARKSESCSYHVFIASGLLEFYLNKDAKVARNIFELGMKMYANEQPYVRQYARFLTHLNEENNIRVLYERAVTAMPPEKAVDIWNDFYEFENTVSDLATVLKMEKRRQAAYPGNENYSGMLGLVQRYRYLDLIPCSVQELESFSRPEERKGMARDLAAGGLSAGRVTRPDVSQMLEYKAEMGLSGNPRAHSSNISLAPSAWPGVHESILRLVASMQGALLPGPPLQPDLMMEVLRELPLPPPPVAAPEPPLPAPTGGKAKDRSRRKGGEAASEEEDEEPAALGQSGEDVFKARQAAKLRRKN